MMAPVLFPSSSEEELFSPPKPVAEALPALVATKRLIWLYFWLLLFEGALRKWILPGLSNPLLLIRDRVVVGVYVAAAAAGLCLASMNVEAAFAPLDPVSKEAELVAGGKSVRGRSVYADQLHGEIEDPDTARFGP